MSYAKAQLAIENQLVTPLGALLVQWPNGPKIDPAGAAYAEVFHLVGRSSVDTLGERGEDLVPCITQVDLYYPLESGSNQANAAVDAFRTAFSAGQWLTYESQSVLVRGCGPGPARRDGTYYKAIVEIHWEARMSRTPEEQFQYSCILRIPRDVAYPAPYARRHARYWKDPPDADPGVSSGLKLPSDASWITVLNPVITLLDTSCLLTIAFSAQFTVSAGTDAYHGVVFRATAQQGAVVQPFPGAGDEFESFIARRTDNGDGVQIQSAFNSSLEVAPGLSTDIKIQCQADVASCYILFANLNMSY